MAGQYTGKPAGTAETEEAMSVENVKKYLEQFGLDGKVREFEQSSATVELAAQAAGEEQKKIAKTLSFKVEDSAILIV